MKNHSESGESYLQKTTLEEENYLIAEARKVLYKRLKTHGKQFESPQAVRDFLAMQLINREQEIFCCLFLDSQHHLIEFQEMFRGTIDGCSVYPREVVKTSLALNAAAVMFAHNHPSGVAEPSQADRSITKRLQEALSLMDIRVLDHFVIGNSEIVSFAERGLL